jgi:hypothetical protein
VNVIICFDLALGICAEDNRPAALAAFLTGIDAALAFYGPEWMQVPLGASAAPEALNDKKLTPILRICNTYHPTAQVMLAEYSKTSIAGRLINGH